MCNTKLVDLVDVVQKFTCAIFQQLSGVSGSSGIFFRYGGGESLCGGAEDLTPRCRRTSFSAGIMVFPKVWKNETQQRNKPKCN